MFFLRFSLHCWLICGAAAPQRGSSRWRRTHSDTRAWSGSGCCCRRSRRTQRGGTPRSEGGSTTAGRTRCRRPPTSAPGSVPRSNLQRGNKIHPSVFNTWSWRGSKPQGVCWSHRVIVGWHSGEVESFHFTSHACCWSRGGSWRTWRTRKPCSRGEHANLHAERFSIQFGGPFISIKFLTSKGLWLHHWWAPLNLYTSVPLCLFNNSHD